MAKRKSGNSRGNRKRYEYVQNTPNTQLSPSGSYIRLIDWRMSYNDFCTHANEQSFVREVNPTNPKDRDSNKRYVTYEDQTFKTNGLRLTTFRVKGGGCIECGIVGQYFVLEKSMPCDSWHINLYGLTNEGNEVMLTQDHIRPKSKGGPDHIDNSQTMCKKCNETKSDKYKWLLEVGEEYHIIHDERVITFKITDIKEGDYFISHNDDDYPPFITQDVIDSLSSNDCFTNFRQKAVENLLRMYKKKANEAFGEYVEYKKKIKAQNKLINRMQYLRKRNMTDDNEDHESNNKEVNKEESHQEDAEDHASEGI